MLGAYWLYSGFYQVFAAVFDLNDESIGKYVYINQGGTTNLTLSVANLVMFLVVAVVIVGAIAAAIPRRMVN
jgi:hypothetical protein